MLPYDEYRILIINGNVEVVHIKQYHDIVADGKKTLAQLLKSKKEKEKDNLFISMKMKERGLTPQSVLTKGTSFPYHITKYSNPDGYYESKKVPHAVVKWAQNLSKMLSTDTIGVDVFAPKGISDPSSFIIIELNANPAFEYLSSRYNDSDRMEEMISQMLTKYFK